MMWGWIVMVLDGVGWLGAASDRVCVCLVEVMRI